MDIMLRFKDLCNSCKIHISKKYCCDGINCITRLTCYECWLIHNPILVYSGDFENIKQDLCNNCKKEILGELGGNNK